MLSSAQREDLKALRAESGFFEARQLLDKGADALRQARERLRLTAASSSSHAGEAGEVLLRTLGEGEIVPVGSNEQHLEHLAMEHDTASVVHVAASSIWAASVVFIE